MSTADAQAEDRVPTRDELLARAQALAPAIAERRDEADRLRDLPAETMAELNQADLMRLFQPARWGGLEADPRTLFAVQNVLAEACPSTAWVFGVLSVQSLVIGRLDEQLQADVWARDGRALVSSSFAPVGTAAKVEGGFRLSGRWGFSSGSSFAQWAMVGGRIEDDGAPKGPPAMNLFLVPRADYAIEDVWNTFGLRGTGSNDLVMNDVFVPAHRHVRLDPGLQNPLRAALPRAPLYRLPWQYVFAGTISNFAIGAGRSVLRDFVEVARARVSPYTGKGAKDDPAVAQAIGRLAAELETAEAMFDRHIERQFDYVARDEVLPMQEAWLLRTQLSAELRKITALVDDLALLQGAKATHLASRVTRTWLDLAAARAHGGNTPAMAWELYGGMALHA
jgi:3-hydroxy-9,10-secoandrosta-1,3,5(10)-triene-9,17-dione monooxygenase